MQIETIGKYQLHLIALEMPGKAQWDPFVTIMRFDDEQQDFRCVLEKRHASDHPCASYEEAIDAARRAGTSLLESGSL
ncbi:hypothetical protein [Noviherbaspirillum denitrificans]|uniref:Uncharacterized protein n=1 Tax=Noviherbaspirillum denitrificans TaxID=1968433 RepID=A0A254T7S5_9BURK|nr:hypothetical protein [Noviherbaspirillum denitrificans]OWW18691.1 hypothetical protein AYR66_03705 [Noviherbaspirillum denitrificans]